MPVTTRAQAARAAEAQRTPARPSSDLTFQCPPAPARKETQGLDGFERKCLALALDGDEDGDESIGLEDPSIIWPLNHS